MKRFFLLGWLLSAFCLTALADQITPERARALAKNFMPAGARARLVKHIAGTTESNQPIYIFSRGTGQGYVVISGNDALPEVIGYTDSGDYDASSLPPALSLMLQFYADAADSLNTQKARTAAGPRKAAGTKNIAPLLTTHWHQTGPYNDQAPFLSGTQNRAVTGCVATAASQIVYYWRRDLVDRTRSNTPTYGYGSAPVTDVIPSGTPLKWNLMQDKYNGGEPEETRSAVATLMAVVGRTGWLTYGSSTSGQINDQRAVLSGQFGLNGGTTVWRDNYSQNTWEQMIVQDLEAGRPILYSGVHATQGGHAVVIDGYQASTNLFHYNFGWGGQGDGYWTVDATTGMNGFNEGQGMVYQIYAKKPKLTGKLYLESETLNGRMENRFVARITNKSTLPQNEFYLYALLNGRTPASSTSPQAKNLEVTIPVDSTANVEFTFSPTSTSPYTLYLCDKDKNILDQIDNVPVRATIADLTLKALATDASGEGETTETSEGSIQVDYIYGTKTTDIRATFHNGIQGTPCTPSVKGTLYRLQADGTWTQQTTKTKRATFQVDKSADIVFDLTNLQEGVVYKFEMPETATTSSTCPIQFEANRSVYFKMVGEDLTAETNEDGTVMTVKGNFNAQTFASLTGDERIARYDLTQTLGVKAPLTAANRNALFYVSAESGVLGRNIIADGVCQQLDLTPGYDFQPSEDFHAMEATYHATQAQGCFGTAVLPFNASTPMGLMARRVAQIQGSYILEADSANQEMKAGTPYIILSGNSIDITANGVDVSLNAPNLGTDSLRPTWKNMMGADTLLVLDNGATQYFDKSDGQTIPALTAYIDGLTRRVRAIPTAYATKDRKALQLAKQLIFSENVLNNYGAMFGKSGCQQLSDALEQAQIALTEQPITAQQTIIINRLDSITTSLLEALDMVVEKGTYDCTKWITNPSYETGNTRGWTAKLSAINKVSSSLANYVSGATGECIVRINAGGSISQSLQVENGTYDLSVDFAAEQGHQLLLTGNSDSLYVEANDFGPMYMQTATVKGIQVTDGQLNIAAEGVEDWVKVDNWRLVQTEGLSTGIVSPQDTNSTTIRGMFDLSGRRINAEPEKGVFIKNGRKFIK